MKSKFSKILELKENILDSIELELLNINNLINKKENEINALKLESKSIPNASNYLEFRSFIGMLSNLKEKIKEEKNNLDSFHMQKEILKQRYRDAKIECEKIRFIHFKEIKKLMQNLNRKEEKLLDEIGSNLHYRNLGD